MIISVSKIALHLFVRFDHPMLLLLLDSCNVEWKIFFGITLLCWLPRLSQRNDHKQKTARVGLSGFDDNSRGFLFRQAKVMGGTHLASIEAKPWGHAGYTGKERNV
jgi:hypothetical protein